MIFLTFSKSLSHINEILEFWIFTKHIQLVSEAFSFSRKLKKRSGRGKFDGSVVYIKHIYFYFWPIVRVFSPEEQDILYNRFSLGIINYTLAKINQHATESSW
jgi:hypothetical protein